MLLELLDFSSNGLLTIGFNQRLHIPQMITLLQEGRHLESLNEYINNVLSITMIVQDQDMDLRFNTSYHSWNETMLQV